MEKLKKDIDCYTLDKILTRYNWDDGFDLPLEIIYHPNCERATALKAFYLASGEQYLQDRELEGTKEWIGLLSCLYERIASGCYDGKYVSFKLPLTRVQKYKLLKAAPNTPAVFLEDIAGSKNADRCEQCFFGSDMVEVTERKEICFFCGEEDSWVGKIEGMGYSLICKKCGGCNVVTTIIRPCYVNDTTPREEFGKYNGCQYRA